MAREIFFLISFACGRAVCPLNFPFVTSSWQCISKNSACPFQMAKSKCMFPYVSHIHSLKAEESQGPRAQTIEHLGPRIISEKKLPSLPASKSCVRLLCFQEAKGS